MPKRTNAFQQVVTILHQHLAGDATVEESVMLTDRVTGDEKEVDTVIRSEVAGYEMVLGIEATKQKASRPWVESMIEKHRNLPTNRLVLVAERGASRPSYRYAESAGAALIVPEQLTGDDPVYQVVNRLESIWPKGIALTPDKAEIVVRRDGELVAFGEDAPPDLEVFLADGRSVGTPQSLFNGAFENDFPRMAEMIGLANITEDRDEYFVMIFTDPDSHWTHPHIDPPLPLCLKWTETSELRPIARIQFSGRAVVQVAEVRLTHRRFQDTAVAYGEAQIGGHDALFVVSEDEKGGTFSATLKPDQPTLAKGDDDAEGEGYAAKADD